jgi:hypothetical protein
VTAGEHLDDRLECRRATSNESGVAEGLADLLGVEVLVVHRVSGC